MVMWHVGLTLAVVWLAAREHPNVDYRLVAVGSLLPDLIDKPLELIVFRDGTPGRTYGHTLLVELTLLLAVILYAPARRRITFALVPVAALLHLLEDGLPADTRVLLWPLHGFGFGSRADGMTRERFTDPAVIRQEIIGTACFGLFLLARRLSRKKDPADGG